MSATLLWIIAAILVVVGIVQLIQGQIILGIVLIIAGCLVGPGGTACSAAEPDRSAQIGDRMNTIDARPEVPPPHRPPQPGRATDADHAAADPGPTCRPRSRSRPSPTCPIRRRPTLCRSSRPCRTDHARPADAGPLAGQPRGHRRRRQCRSTARSSSAFVIFERPLMPLRCASAYSWR